MINEKISKNASWQVGAIVKVGFMSLRVLGSRAEKDWMPDIYELESLDGSKQYEFIPHHGLSRVDKPAGIPIRNMHDLDKLMGGGF